MNNTRLISLAHFQAIIILLALFSAVCNGLIVDKSVSSNRFSPHRTQFEKFEFDVGGTIVISGTTSKTSRASFVIISDDLQSSRTEDWYNWVCSEQPPGLRYLLDGKTQNYTISSKDIYYFTIVDCDTATSSAAWTAHLTYTLLSTRDGNQLPLSSIPIPPSFLTALLVWLVTLLTLIATLILRGSHRTPLHMLLLLVVGVKVLVTVVLTVYWYKYSLIGENNTVLEQLKNFLFTFSETAFFFTLYLFSKGWRTTRAGLPTLELRTTSVALTVLLLTLLFFTFYNNDYYWLSLIIVYFFLLPKFFTSISHNCRLLESQISYFQRSHAPQVLNVIASLKAKHSAFKTVRNTVIAYLVLILIVNSIFKALVAIAWEYSWIPIIFDELILYLMITFTCIVLAPSNNGVWLTCIDDLVPLIRAQHFINDHSNDVTNENEAQQEPWNLKKTIVVAWPGYSDKLSQKSVSALPLSIAYEDSYIEDINNNKNNKNSNNDKKNNNISIITALDFTGNDDD